MTGGRGQRSQAMGPTCLFGSKGSKVGRPTHHTRHTHCRLKEGGPSSLRAWWVCWVGGSLSSRCAALHRAALRRHPVLPSTWASPAVARHPRAAGASRRRARQDLRDPPGDACCLRRTPLQVGCESQVSVCMRAATCSNAAAAQLPHVQVVVPHSTERHDHRGRRRGCMLTPSAQERVLLLHADGLRRTHNAEQSRGWPAARRARSWSSTRLARDGSQAGAIVHLRSARSAPVMR